MSYAHIEVHGVPAVYVPATTVVSNQALRNMAEKLFKAADELQERERELQEREREARPSPMDLLEEARRRL